MKKVLVLIFVLIHLNILISFQFAGVNASLKEINQNDTQKVPKSLLKIISVDLYNVTLEKALLTIANKGKFELNYNRSRIPIHKKVTVTMTNVPLIKVLQKILANTGSELTITNGGQFAVIPKNRKKKSTGSIFGKVSENLINRIIPGVYVEIVHTNFSTLTDEKGEFKISNIPAGSYSVKFHIEGFKTVIKTEMGILPILGVEFEF